MIESKTPLYSYEFQLDGWSFLIIATHRGVTFLDITSNRDFINQTLNKLNKFHSMVYQSNEIIYNSIGMLQDYIQGRNKNLSIPIDMMTGTAFQRSVWYQLLSIPYGQVRTYTQLAESIDFPRAVRAVARALANNPILIGIPCHRVVRKDGSLGGYRGGIDLKKALLKIEGCYKYEE